MLGATRKTVYERREFLRLAGIFWPGVKQRNFFASNQSGAQLAIPTISLYEVYKRIVLQRDEEEALSAVAWMTIGLVADLTTEIALAAADLSVEHKLPMADSIILATARAHDATLWTQDEHFKDLPHVKFVEKK